MNEPGRTPLLEVGGIYTKLECSNPTGSVKDRIAFFILEESERQGWLRPGMKIVEATSGNTGIALAYFGVQKGYRVVIVMPENMTEERKQLIRDLGAELILCRAGDFAEAALIRDKMCKEPETFNPDQFSNPLNVVCHYKTTGQEILAQMSAHSDSIDAFVAGVGTGGTLIGVAQALKERFPKIHIAAVEPSESAVMSGKKADRHGIPGIGDGFIPDIVRGARKGLHDWIDEVVCIDSGSAKSAAIVLQQRYNFCVGISSGANFMAAKRLAGRFKTVVTVFPDGYSKYKTEGLRHCGEGRCPYEKPAGYSILNE
ncbi:MAG TPA: cysteine synthase family protein [Bdellovibrionota bacterium]|nr:cysteine synthase family protein [Bdellovibrionota bacterium]